MKKILAIVLFLLSTPIYATVDPGDNPAMYSAIDRIESWAQAHQLDVSLGHQGKGDATDPWFVTFQRVNYDGIINWEISGCDSLAVAEPVIEAAVSKFPKGYADTKCK